MSKATNLTRGQSQPKRGQEDLIAQCLTYEWTTILDAGSGSGWVAQRFLAAGRKPFTTFALIHNPDVHDFGPLPLDHMDAIATGSMDAVWAAHVLEHCHNTGQALGEIHRVLRRSGWLFLSVPPFKHAVVGGHVNVGWNLGIMAYVLALHGFDARRGAFIRHGYNLAAFVKKTELPLIELTHDAQELDRIAHLLPESVRIAHNSNGDVDEINWSWRILPKHVSSHFLHGTRRQLSRIAGRWI